MMGNKQVIVEELARVGLKPHAIAGILGNLEIENGFNTTLNNGDGGQASGIAQWHPDRFARVREVAKRMGLKPTDIRAQARALALSIKDEGQSGPTGTTTVKSLNGLKNARAVAKFFDENYERSDGSARQARMQAAKKYLPLARRASSGSQTQGETPTPKVPGSKNGTMTWVPKVGNEVSNPYGAPGDYAAGHHTGSDIPGGAGGQPIRWAPPMSGKVVKSGTGGAYGNHMIIRDEKGREWLLAHMSSEPLAKGTTVQQGEKIGNVGNTGNSKGAHLHIEMTEPLGKGEHWQYDANVKKPKLVFKVGTDGTVYDKDFKPTDGDFLDIVGLSGQAITRPGNEELEALIDKAVANDWTTQEFTRQFKASKWYQDRAKSQRDFDMLQDTDQQQKIKTARAEIRQTSAGMGVTLTKEEERQLAVRVARDGYNSQQVQWYIGRRYKGGEDTAQGGLALSTRDALKDKARDYGVRLDSSVLDKWVKEVLQKGTPVDSFDDDLAGYAEQQNPFLKDSLGRGLTTREALQSYVNSAATLMGMTEDEIDLADPKWRETFKPDGTALSDYEWQKKIRSDPRYGYGNTKNAVEEARMHGRNLMRTMGVFSG